MKRGFRGTVPWAKPSGKGVMSPFILRHAGLVPASIVPRILTPLVCGTMDPGTSPG